MRPKRHVKQSIPRRLETIFHTADPQLPSISTCSSSRSKRKITQIHVNPNIFMITDFLSATDLDHFDHLVTANESLFSASFTDNGAERIITTERTSTFLFLSKQQDVTVRRIESRIADLVGLHEQCVEPLQIVRYTGTQAFAVHHDAGTLLDNGEIDAVLPMRLVTLFVYLNSLPEGLGSTEFPTLGKLLAKPSPPPGTHTR